MTIQFYKHILCNFDPFYAHNLLVKQFFSKPLNLQFSNVFVVNYKNELLKYQTESLDDHWKS